MRFFHTSGQKVFAAVLLIFVLALLLQWNLLVYWDVSWDLFAAKRLAAGGTYSRDFFDLNPPLILYLLMPAVWLGESIHHPDLALRLYILGISLCSLLLCRALIKPVFASEKKQQSNLFLVVLAFVLALLPGTLLGQREQLLVAFTLPYYLLVNYRLSAERPNTWLAAGVGLFAALGFALKPHFLVAFVLVEAYVAVRRRSLLAWMRTEVFVLAGFMLAYAALVYFRYPDYLYQVVPMAMAFYYTGFAASWRKMFSNDLLCFSAGVLVWFLCSRRHSSFNTLLSLFACGFTGALFSYFSQRTGWTYHVLPAFSLAIIMACLLGYQWYEKHRDSVLRIAGVAALCLGVPFLFILENNTNARRYKMDQQPLIAFMKSLAPDEPVYCMTASPSLAFPSVSEANVVYASRLLHLFWVPGAVKKAAARPLSAREKKLEQAFVSMVTEDIARYRPAYVLVDAGAYHHYFDARAFDFPAYLSRDAAFAQIWKSYRPANTLSSAIIGPYEYQVYQRVDIPEKR